MKTRIDRQSAVDLAVALVFAAVVALSAFLWNTSGMKGVAPAISPFLVMRPLEMREEVIADYAGVQRVYEFDLTKASGVRAGTLFVHLRHTVAVVEKDGRIVADTGETQSWHIGRTPGNYWLALPIYPEDAGKTLRVTLTPVYQSVRALEPDFLVIDRQMLLHLEVLPDEAAVLLLCEQPDLNAKMFDLAKKIKEELYGGGCSISARSPALRACGSCAAFPSCRCCWIGTGGKSCCGTSAQRLIF